LPDQISLIPSLRRRGLVLAMGDGDGADKNEIVIFVARVTANDCPHDVLPCRFDLDHFQPIGIRDSNNAELSARSFVTSLIKTLNETL